MAQPVSPGQLSLLDLGPLSPQPAREVLSIAVQGSAIAGAWRARGGLLGGAWWTSPWCFGTAVCADYHRQLLSDSEWDPVSSVRSATSAARRMPSHLRVQARRGNQVLGEHRGRVPTDLRAATRRHQPVLEGRGGCRGRQSVGRQSGQRTGRQPQGHGQRPRIFVCIVGRRPHRVLGIQQHQ